MNLLAPAYLDSFRKLPQSSGGRPLQVAWTTTLLLAAGFDTTFSFQMRLPTVDHLYGICQRPKQLWRPAFPRRLPDDAADGGAQPAAATQHR